VRKKFWRRRQACEMIAESEALDLGSGKGQGNEETREKRKESKRDEKREKRVKEKRKKRKNEKRGET
jgi:hypothetical protein